MKRLLTIALALASLNRISAADPQLVNAIVAIVNETIITEMEARTLIEPALVALDRQAAVERWSRQTYLERKREIEKDGLNLLIDRQLTLDDFKATGNVLPESLIEEFVQERIRDRYVGDRVKLIKTLDAQNMTFEQFRSEMRDQFIVEHMNNRNVSSAVIVSPFKIETYYKEHQDEFKMQDQVHIRMIELRKQPGADPKAVLGRATDIEKIIAAGTPFSEMAKTYSEGSQKADGGDLGWRNRSEIRKEFADAIAMLKPGQLTGVIDLPDACFLLQVDGVKTAQVRPLSEVREDIEKTLLNQERARLQRKYVERLRKNAFVRFY